MTTKYKARDIQDRPFNDELCAAATPGVSGRFFQCARKSKRDGWCWQHHPDREAERTRKTMERDMARFEHSPTSRLLRKALAENARLRTLVGDLVTAGNAQLSAGSCDLCYEDPCDPSCCDCGCHERVRSADKLMRDTIKKAEEAVGE